jgi:hypothetical protein
MTSEQRSVEDFLDTLCQVWGGIDMPDGTKLKSYRVFSVNELPSSPILAAQAPCVATYVDDPQISYNEMGCRANWGGTSEFHLTKDVKPANLKDIMLFYRRILRAAIANRDLGGVAHVSSFLILQNTSGAMRAWTFQHPATGADDHQGIIVKWMVVQNLDGQYALT